MHVSSTTRGCSLFDIKNMTLSIKAWLVPAVFALGVLVGALPFGLLMTAWKEHASGYRELATACRTALNEANDKLPAKVLLPIEPPAK